MKCYVFFAGRTEFVINSHSIKVKYTFLERRKPHKFSKNEFAHCVPGNGVRSNKTEENHVTDVFGEKRNNA